MSLETMDSGLRRAVLIVALPNLACFGMDFAVAIAIGSVSLFADGIHFLEDTSGNLPIFFVWMGRQDSRQHWDGAGRCHTRACIGASLVPLG